MYPLPPNERTGHPHVQVEAFCLMRYKADDSEEVELIWNSRDGVTPFCITMKSGQMGKHIDWRRDQYTPNHVPAVGDRIFIDLSPKRARELSGRNYDLWSREDPEFLKRYPDREAFVESNALSMLEGFWPHTPTLVEVTEELRKEFIRPPAQPSSRGGRFA